MFVFQFHNFKQKQFNDPNIIFGMNGLFLKKTAKKIISKNTKKRIAQF
jgi:hypothetical protein